MQECYSVAYVYLFNIRFGEWRLLLRVVQISAILRRQILRVRDRLLLLLLLLLRLLVTLRRCLCVGWRAANRSVGAVAWLHAVAVVVADGEQLKDHSTAGGDLQSGRIDERQNATRRGVVCVIGGCESGRDEWLA